MRSAKGGHGLRLSLRFNSVVFLYTCLTKHEKQSGQGGGLMETGSLWWHSHRQLRPQAMSSRSGEGPVSSLMSNIGHSRFVSLGWSSTHRQSNHLIDPQHADVHLTGDGSFVRESDYPCAACWIASTKYWSAGSYIIVVSWTGHSRREFNTVW